MKVGPQPLKKQTDTKTPKEPIQTQNVQKKEESPLICLIIMIRDGKTVIGPTLRAALPYMDRWFIFDTGSKDGTQEYIKSLVKDEFPHVPGRIVEEPFVDFEVSRSRALELAGQKFGECIFQIMLDDSYILHGGEILRAFLDLKRKKQDEDDDDGYMIKIGKATDSITYSSARIFRTDKNIRYEGVVHEVPTCSSADVVIPSLCYIEDNGTPETVERSRQRFNRDLKLLLPEVRAKRGNYTRNVFYLAQTYGCLLNYKKAMEWYQIRTEMDPGNENGFWGEVFISFLRMGYIAQKKLHLDWPICQNYFLQAHGVDTSRWEPLYRIAKYYKKYAKGSETVNWNLCHTFSHLAVESSEDYQSNDLFVDGNIYANKMPILYSLSSWYCDYGRGKHHQKAREMLLKRIKHYPHGLSSEDLECFDEKLKNQDVDKHYPFPARIIGEIIKRQKLYEENKDKLPNIVFTMTTCKRFDLFSRTINSFLHCCTDLDLISRWIIVDDNSSLQDRTRMGKLYPFFEFVLKTPDQKGHAKSMNCLVEMTKSTNSHYIFHMEDDWLFIEKKPYLSLLLDIFASEPDSCKQALINRNYSERLYDDHIRIVGGFHKQTRHEVKYVLHQHINPQKSKAQYNTLMSTLLPNQGSHAYWPNYSLRPGLLKREVWDELGLYDENHVHFEKDYAEKYTAAGYTTAFLDGIYSLHIGKLTTDQESDVPSAYTLNKTKRF